ncbi:MAG: hypothetical protein EOO61_16955 [Hymenobacter sp.]|nr:MAG: hypothetical protein EOO61_16955 [Hymenobacter sp.]
MYPNDIEQVIEKFQDAVGVPEYNGVIEKLIRKAYDHKIDIILSNYPSSARQDRVHGIDYTIKILRLPDSGDTKEILFDMMHEMGHCFDPAKLLPDRSNEKERETRAWEFADEQFYSFPELAAIEQQYTIFRNSRLQVYLDN